MYPELWVPWYYFTDRIFKPGPAYKDLLVNCYYVRPSELLKKQRREAVICYVVMLDHLDSSANVYQGDEKQDFPRFIFVSVRGQATRNIVVGTYLLGSQFVFTQSKRAVK